MKPTVIVLDGEQRAALATVRSIGRQGWPVHVGSAAKLPMAGGSRFAASETPLPDPLAAPIEYRAAVAKMIATLRADLVIPITEASTLALLEGPGEVAGPAIPTADLARFRLASDKESVLARAARIGISVPKQWTVSGEAGSEGVVPEAEFPVVIKPARSVVGPEGERRKVGVRYAKTRGELGRLLGEFGTEAGPFLLQSKVEGPGLGVFLLRWQGRIVASFAHRRVREKPPSGGVSVCCESVAAPAELVARSTALLDEIDWTGVAMIEFKRDVRTGEDYLMEINPRFWGSLQLAIDAGVDFPWYLAQLAMGRDVTPVHSWRVGVRSRWSLGEVDHLIARLRRSPAALDLPSSDPGLFRTVMAMIRPRWRQRSDVFRLSDPVPGIRESIEWVRELYQ